MSPYEYQNGVDFCGGGSTLALAPVPSMSHLSSLWWEGVNSRSWSVSISVSTELIVLVGRSTLEKCGVNSAFLSTDSFLLRMIGSAHCLLQRYILSGIVSLLIPDM